MSDKFCIFLHVCDFDKLSHSLRNFLQLYSMIPISKPTLQRIQVDAPIEKFIEVIKRDGGCICTNFVMPEDVAAANAEVKTFLDADKPWQVSLQ